MSEGKLSMSNSKEAETAVARQDLLAAPERDTARRVPPVEQGESPRFLSSEKLRLIIFGGKGGTGKTTSAAATAIYLAKLRPTKRILVISTDPAHSLGDSFDCSLGSEWTPIYGMPNLSAMEIEPAELLETFRKDHVREIKEVVQRSGFYGQVDMKEFLSFALPGMEDIMTLLELAKMLKKGWHKSVAGPTEYGFRSDLIILDSAPTGHTLKLLSLPERTDSWVNTFDRSLDKYRVHPRLYSFGSKPKKGGDWADRFVWDMKEDLKIMSSLLTNAEEAEFVPVLIPEPMAIAETEDLLQALSQRQIAVRNIIVNRVHDDRDCEFCSPKAAEQKEAIAGIREKFSGYNPIEMPLFPHEIQGERRLLEYADIYTKREKLTVEHVEPLLERSHPAPNLPRLLEKDLQFILFGGKGGVGKTSTASATALHLARQHPDKKVLIYSIDPAHSVADSLDCPVGDHVIQVPGVDNLYALETDAEKLLESLMNEYRETIKSAFETWASHDATERRIALKWDQRFMEAFSESSPPGLDEILALEQIMGFMEEGKYDLYVLDTAPTGHLLELLQLPQLLRDWLRYAYRGLLKWHLQLPLTELTDLRELIFKSSKTVEKVRGIFTDPERSEFVAVTIPEAMGVAETVRLVSSIQRLKIPWQHIIINQMIPPTQCDFCATKSKEQLSYVEQIRDTLFPGSLVTEIPLLSHEISGLEDLTELAAMMYGEPAAKAMASSEKELS